MPWNSKCDDTKDGSDTAEMQDGVQATRITDALPNISSSDKPIVKKVAIVNGGKRSQRKKKQF